MFTVTAFYKFAHIPAIRTDVFQKDLTQFMDEHGVKGLVLVSTEGINGTIAGTAEAIAATKQFLEATPELGAITFKDSFSEFIPFKRLKVDLREEIVTLKRPDIFPDHVKNHHLSPQEWHAELTSENKDYVLIDTRNFYEVEIGKFQGALDPKTTHFSEFPDYIQKQNFSKDQKILMYCTGGIRCEKALVYMQQEGFENVYQLEGGILNYINEYPEGAWEGECFIFDHRVALDKNLQPSAQYKLCPHCGNPGDIALTCRRCQTDAVVCKHCHPKEYLDTCSKNCAHELERIAKRGLSRRAVTRQAAASNQLTGSSTAS
jgi:UPF0176 protein